MTTTTITKYICRTCGADYSSGSSAAKARHPKVKGCTGGWKTTKVIVEAPKSVISYQPGYGPDSVTRK